MYPYILLKKDIEVFPIFGNNNNKIYFLSMEDESNWLKGLNDNDIKNQKKFQKKIDNVFNINNVDIIISGYLENRKRMFSILGFKQMISEGRFFHLGLDLSVKYNTPIYSPLDSKVYETGYEKGAGNYGGYIILEHKINSYIFYTIYGHLNPDNFFINKGDLIQKGTKMGTIGDFSQNGGYFFHTHLQVITKLGKLNNFFNKGYCTENQIKNIYKYTPDPSFLFKY